MELLISVAILSILSISVNTFLQDIKLNTVHADMKARALSELTIANDALSNLVNNSYGIAYSDLSLTGDL